MATNQAAGHYLTKNKERKRERKYQLLSSTEYADKAESIVIKDPVQWYVSRRNSMALMTWKQTMDEGQSVRGEKKARTTHKEKDEFSWRQAEEDHLLREDERESRLRNES